jgi:predicted aspartyl protease
MVLLAAAMLCCAAAPRQELPIHETSLPDGELRYSVPVKIGTVTIDTMLDTGSTGLRVLPGVLGSSDYAPTSASSAYDYGSGALLSGAVAKGSVQLGDLAPATVRFEAVDKIGCTAARPHCPASRMAQSDYGIGGSGFAKTGFKAIIGTRFGSAEVDHPFEPLGVDRWIVELPKAGEAGRLILNPTAEEAAGYTLFRMPDNRTSAIPACLIRLDTSDKVCGRLLLDTGAPGILVENKGPAAGLPWARGTAAAIVVQNGDGVEMSLRFTVGASRNDVLALDPNAHLPFTRISGLVPFVAWSVFYDNKTRVIGLKAR